MEYHQAIQIVDESKRNRHFTAVIDGKRENLRLFVSSEGILCQFKKGSKKWGYPIDPELLMKISSLTPYDQKTDGVKIFRRNLEKIIKHLSASHLWPQILEDAKALQKIDDALIQEWANKSRRELYETSRDLRDNGILPEQTEQTYDCGLTCELFANLFDAKSIKTINYHSWGKEMDIEKFAKAISNREHYNYSWHKGYDNSIGVRDDSGVLKAWYSEEYRGCGNGHYYLALSATHAIFHSDD